MVSSTTTPTTTVYLITGASRGIGLALTVAAAKSNANTIVFAAARNTQQLKTNLTNLDKLSADELSRIHPVELDVASDDSIAKARKAVGEELAKLGLKGINVLINNAGVAVDFAGFADVKRKDLQETFNINVFGVVAVTQAFADLVVQAAEAETAAHKESSSSSSTSTNTKVVIISSIAGSLGVLYDETTPEALKTEPGFHFLRSDSIASYRASKAAVNAIARASLQPYFNAKHIPVFSLHPGTVDTDMAKQVGMKPPLSSADSAAGILKVLTESKYEDQKYFWSYDGTVLPW